LQLSIRPKLLATTTSSGLTASLSSTGCYEQQQQQQQLDTWSLDNITSIDITVPTTMMASFGSYTSLLWPWIRIVLVTLCTLGVLFNGFVLFVLVYAKYTRSVASNMFIINQTLADLLDCLSIIISGTTASYKHEYVKMPGSVAICIMFESNVFISICNNASIVGLVVLTLERYFKIVYPIKYRQKFRPWMNWVGVVLPWVDGIVIGVPLIAATTGFDPQKSFCRALVNFTSPTAQKVCTSRFTSAKSSVINYLMNVVKFVKKKAAKITRRTRTFGMRHAISSRSFTYYCYL